MTRFAVSLPTLCDVVDRLAAFDRSVEMHLAAVDARVRSLAMTWTGEAAGTYAAAHATWTRDVEEMRAAVQRMQIAMDVVHGNYHAAVAANQAMWG